MKSLFSKMRTVYATVSILTVIFSCKKEVNSTISIENNHTSFVINDERKALINQAVMVYDSSFLQADSMQFSSPAYSRTYEWKVMPDNGCYSREGIKNKAAAEFIFHCSGTYSFSAIIYDSLHNKIGVTDTATIRITTDTLLATQPPKPNDTLGIYPQIDSIWISNQLPHTTPPDKYIFNLFFVTGKRYNTCFPNSHLSFSSNITGNNYQFAFTGVTLSTYPFTFGPVYPMSEALGGIVLEDVTLGSTVNLSLDWAGSTYAGKIVFADKDHYITDWDNTGLTQVH